MDNHMKPISKKEPGLNISRDALSLMQVKHRWLNNKSPYAPINMAIGWEHVTYGDYRHHGHA